MSEWEQTLTVDASYDRSAEVTGIGVVAQTRVGTRRRGPIVERIAEPHSGIASGSGETFAVLRALEIAKERGFTRVKIRSDYNAMRRRLREQHRSRAAGDDDLQRKVIELAGSFAWVDLGYVPRRKNQLAHNLARRGVVLARERRSSVHSGCDG